MPALSRASRRSLISKASCNALETGTPGLASTWSFHEATIGWIRPERLSGRSAGMDHRQVQGVDRPEEGAPRGRYCPGSRPVHDLAPLDHRHRRFLRQSVFRSSSGERNAAGAPPHMRSSRGRRFPTDPILRQHAGSRFNIVHWSEYERGGHFAAMEAPDLYAQDLCSFFRTVRAGTSYPRAGVGQ
jgi:hypothetical protein